MSSSHKLQPFSTYAPLPNGLRDTHLHPRRSVTPNGRIPANSSRLMNTIEGDLGAEEDPRLAIFKDLYTKSEARLASLFEEQEKYPDGKPTEADGTEGGSTQEFPVQPRGPVSAPSNKRPARAIDEDDYDDPDSEGDNADERLSVSPLRAKATLPTPSLALSSTSMLRSLSSGSTPASVKGAPSAGKTTEAARKKLEEEKKALQNATKRTFHTLFYTLENDKDAMLEQKKLDEAERQYDAELGTGNHANGAPTGNGSQGILSQTNLGASSLTLKNLIRRIDDQRDKVKASDAELRSLMSEVRKNRSKWASEEKMGQEELYEAAEKVLNELKAMTEHSTAFLNKVNKREAPEYYNLIKHPMDLGTMTKKLKNLQYKSKAEFVEDLNVIWANCLRYNNDPTHFMRKHALYMRKETEKLVPLIPEIVIKDRAEKEAEDRRRDANLAGDEDSDDEPIISSRGRKAPSKKSKKGTVARKAPAGGSEGLSAMEIKSGMTSLVPNGVSNLKDQSTRAESENRIDGSQTPPFGTITPVGINGISNHGAGQSEPMDIDSDSIVNCVIPSIGGMSDEAENDDPEYKTWKQVTKKDRANVTAERHRLFKGDGLDPEAPALIRTKAGMRSWLRKQKHTVSDNTPSNDTAGAGAADREDAGASGETLAEGMEVEEERMLPDYYDVLGGIPDLPSRLRWTEDADGNVQEPSDEFLRVMPKGLFVSPESVLATKIEDNLRQIQKTRKLTSKIGVVKQMQLQSQLYQGQFQKHEVQPFVEQDVEPHVVSDDGPVIAPTVCRAALQRTTAKLLVHAGFEEFQPSALDTLTDLAGDYFSKIALTLNEYTQAPQIPTPVPGNPGQVTWKPRFTAEESILHTLHQNGMDLDALDTYVTEDVERTGTRLATSHDRMKAHLAEILRPALNDAGPDGSNAFNDGSEQFVGGNFADELGEDFFGFKELGLDLEFGSVPLHLLQSRISNASQAQNQSTLSSSLPAMLDTPPRWPPITLESIPEIIGLAQNFFYGKVHANNDQPLVEDEELPQKQRFPKPRLPPTGKITSPRKRPLKEPGPGKGHPRKKLKLNDGEAKPIDPDVGTNDAEQKGKEDGEKEKEKTKSPSKKDNHAHTHAHPHPHSLNSTGGEILTNGIHPSPAPAAAPVILNGLPVSSKDKDRGKMKEKEKEKEARGRDSAGMISPESLEAT